MARQPIAGLGEACSVASSVHGQAGSGLVHASQLPRAAPVPAGQPRLPRTPHCPCPAEAQQQQQQQNIRNRINRVAVDEGALQQAVVQVC